MFERFYCKIYLKNLRLLAYQLFFRSEVKNQNAMLSKKRVNYFFKFLMRRIKISGVCYGWGANIIITITFRAEFKEEFTAPNYKPGVVRHIVLLRYKPEVSDAQRIAILERFRNLKNTSLRNGHPYIVAIHTKPHSNSNH